MTYDLDRLEALLKDARIGEVGQTTWKASMSLKNALFEAAPALLATARQYEELVGLARELLFGKDVYVETCKCGQCIQCKLAALVGKEPG